jgi:hypothetical protein
MASTHDLTVRFLAANDRFTLGDITSQSIVDPTLEKLATTIAARDAEHAAAA